MKISDFQKFRLFFVYSIVAGFIGVVVFILIENRDLQAAEYFGGFLMTFVPIFAIMLFQYFVASRHLVRLHGVFNLLLTSLVYFIIIIAVMLAVIFIFGLSPEYEAGRMEFYEVLAHPDTRTGILFLAITIIIVQFFLLVDSFLGRGMLVKLFLGMYHKPKESKRIFMFLDLVSSTKIAEKNGDIQFLSLLQDFFFDLNEAAAEHKGEIYKYVGDEAILVWKLEGKKKNQRCLDFYFRLKQIIEEKQNTYLKKYEWIPEFKAGVHCGTVVMGEIGREKKEITYMGDVINTAARIESLCNEYNEKLFLSGELVNSLGKSENYVFQLRESLCLRGKEKETKIYNVEKKS